MPQATVLNDATGFVLACERPILHGKEFVEDPLNGGSPVNIPDNNATGVSRTFTFTGAGTVSGIRVFADIRHPRRGDINVFLIAPDNTTITLEGSDTSTRRDIIAVFPDTRQYNDDVVAMIGKNVAGTWTVRVNDISAGPTSTQNNILPGQILYLAVEIDANTGTSTNQSPVANAGPNQSVTEGSPVVLDGTSSFDPDADPISYTWSQAGGPPVTLVGANTATPAFTAPLVGSNQVCSFQLTVDDGNGGIGTDFVSVTVLDVVAPNNAPTADAGVDFSVESGDTANLDATASADPDGDPLSFSWTQLSGPGVTLAASGTATPSFTAPTVVASTMITMQVTVDDGRGGQHADTVTVTVEPPNNPPVADAGTDVNAVRNAVVTLFGGGSSDPDGDPLTYLWTQVAGTNQVTLNNSTTATPDFIAPATDDVLILQLLVDDGRGAQSVDTVTVTVTSNGGSTTGKKSSKNSEEGCSTGDQGSYLWLAVLALCGGWLLWRRRQSNLNLKLQRQNR
jgi:subtilisin-like proprotein convertase family protein